MSRRWLLSLLCLFAVVVALTIFAQLSSAAVGLSVNESATKFLIQDQTIVVLEVDNPTQQQVTAHLKLDLIDTDDEVRGAAIRDVSLKPGTNKLSIPLTLSANDYQGDDTLPWYRLRYQINARPANKQTVGAAQGFISLSEIDTPNIFAMEVTAPGRTHRSARYYVHVRTLGAISPNPVKDAKVSVELSFDEASPRKTIKASGIIIQVDFGARLPGVATVTRGHRQFAVV